MFCGSNPDTGHRSVDTKSAASFISNTPKDPVCVRRLQGSQAKPSSPESSPSHALSSETTLQGAPLRAGHPRRPTHSVQCIVTAPSPNPKKKTPIQRDLRSLHTSQLELISTNGMLWLLCITRHPLNKQEKTHLRPFRCDGSSHSSSSSSEACVQCTVYG